MMIDQEFDQAKGAFAARMQVVEQNQVRQTWSVGPVFSVDPYAIERSGLKPGKLLGKVPTTFNQRYCYYFDADERILLIKEGTSVPDLFQYEFFFADGELLKSYLYDDEDLVNVRMRSYKDGKLAKLVAKAVFGAREETYSYEGDRLQSIKVKQWSDGVEQPGFVAHFKYEGDKLVQIAHVFENGYTNVVYPLKAK